MHKIRTNQGEKIIYSRLENKSFKSWMKIDKSNGFWLVRLDVNHIFFSPFNNLKNSNNSAYFISKLREFAIYWAYSEIQSEERREGVSQFRERFADLIEKNRELPND